MTKVIDIHCHLGVPEAEAFVASHGGATFSAMAAAASDKTNEVNARQFATIGCKLTGVDERLVDMDRLGIDMQVLSPNPAGLFYHIDPEIGLAASRITNDRIAEAVAGNPDRFAGLGTVPLQNAEFAVGELRRCVSDLGLRGVEISTNVRGADLHTDALRPFWAEAEALGILVFIHPLGFSQPDRMRDYYFNNLIGNPLESTLAIGHLIFGGVLDRYPVLKICVAHGGGFLPSYWGRFDHGWRARADCSEHCQHLPSSYLRQIWFDTLVFDRDQLDALVRSHGADRLCLGTDYPFDMGEPDPVGFHDRLSEADRAKILGDNAQALLGYVDGKATH